MKYGLPSPLLETAIHHTGRGTTAPRVVTQRYVPIDYPNPCRPSPIRTGTVGRIARGIIPATRTRSLSLVRYDYQLLFWQRVKRRLVDVKVSHYKFRRRMRQPFRK